MSIYIQLIIAVFTIAMSGVVASVVSHKLNENKDDRNFKRQKIENIFISFHEWSSTLSMAFIPYISVMRGELTFDDVHEMIISKGSPKEPYYQNLIMNISIYFPALKSDLDKMFEIRTNLNKVIYEYKNQYKKGLTDGSAWIAPLNKELAGFEELSQIIEDKIIAQARDI